MSDEALQRRLGYTFTNAGLLRQALTHRSHGRTNNERLEFLGDSVLNCVVSTLLYHHFPKIDEGDLSRLRANLVKQQSLYEIAQRLELSADLLLGEGELKSGGFRRPSILGDTVEAIFGAIYLDGGFAAAQTVLGMLFSPVIASVDPKTLGKDAKTLLQEYLQGRKISLPVYAVVATHGAAHNQMFEVECAIPKLSIQVLGNGGSRRAAEQAAARRALEEAQRLAPTPGKRPRIRGTERKPGSPEECAANTEPRQLSLPTLAPSALAPAAAPQSPVSATPLPLQTPATATPASGTHPMMAARIEAEPAQAEPAGDRSRAARTA